MERTRLGARHPVTSSGRPRDLNPSAATLRKRELRAMVAADKAEAMKNGVPWVPRPHGNKR